MHLLAEWYPMYDTLAERLPALRPAQVGGLTSWVAGSVLAGSACESAVVLALGEALAADGQPVVANTLRQSLREWLRDGRDKDAPCATEVAVDACFPQLLAWLVELLGGERLALALDATHYQDRFIALVVSVLYRGRAVPVAWQIRTAQTRGAWMPVICNLLCALAPAIPAERAVLLVADEGLCSPRLYQQAAALGWQPLLRGHANTIVRLRHSGRQCSAAALVPGPGHASVARVTFNKDPQRQFQGTLIVVWAVGEAQPWVLLTTRAPRQVGVLWYGLRAWIECGFRDLKALGWQWERTQRADPRRIERAWLVLAVATLWVLAAGTKVEEAERQGLPRALVRAPLLPPAAQTGRRWLSVFQRGLRALVCQLLRGGLDPELWLAAEAWPEAPATLVICYPDPDDASP